MLARRCHKQLTTALVAFYDDNGISIDATAREGADFGDNNRENVPEAYGWNVIGRSTTTTSTRWTRRSMKPVPERKPTLGIYKTTISKGSQFQGTSRLRHALLLGDEEIFCTKKALGWSTACPFDSAGRV